MHVRKSDIKRVIFVLLGLLSVLAVYYFLFGDAITNDRCLSQITSQLNTLSQPPNTIQISSRSAVGLLSGNGNHCDFFTGSVYRSQSTVEVIQQHYKGRQFQNPVTGKDEDWDLIILKDDHSFDSVWLPDDFDHPGAWQLTPASYATGTLFLVYAMRSYDANGDSRCN